ncbi:Glycerophosphodiester phosphodiesterase domain-containing protein 5 [Labeo rohita]|uniref:Glycerophosphodiester phosphodiesterase domain-containing protein 5 n=1 Tax=Labeo rohita TaxID=84645 RepID=A0ABQ8LN51_LABRO|nr:Glycerophosphodiester phosphodiesterase domain-containing protein 5 [Labeo rohita]
MDHLRFNICGDCHQHLHFSELARLLYLCWAAGRFSTDGSALFFLAISTFHFLSVLWSLHAPVLRCSLKLLSYHLIRWKMSGMHSYNPEQIMLSAVVRRPSRDVNLMKEKLIFSGETEHTAVWR